MSRGPARPAEARRRYELPARIAVRAPMKLVIAGEYSVLEPGSPGIVAAVDRYVTATAAAAPAGAGVRIAAPTVVGGAEVEARAAHPRAAADLEFDVADARHRAAFAFSTHAAALAYALAIELGLEPRPLALRIESEGGHVVIAGTGERAKLGLGTSAAAAVAVVGAVLGAHGVPIDRPVFRRAAFRLALVAHARAQGGRGSGIDVAAAAHGGIIEYARAEASWLRRIDRGAPVLDIARGPWPGLRVEALPVLRSMRLLAGFTGTSRPTPDLVARIEAWKVARPGEFGTFADISQKAARSLARALRGRIPEDVVSSIKAARKALAYLGAQAGVQVETPALQKLAEVARDAGGAGKASGAGGGDCGIAVAFDEDVAARIEEGWRAAAITPIEVGISPVGMHEVREE